MIWFNKHKFVTQHKNLNPVKTLYQNLIGCGLDTLKSRLKALYCKLIKYNHQ